MSAVGGGYDLSVSTYSVDGRVFQVEYAQKAVEKEGTAIGIKCSDGVVVGLEKILQSKMLVKSSNKRIYTVDRHAGVALNGLAADSRALSNRIQEEASSYKEFYGVAVPGHVLADRVAQFVHAHTLYWYLRPFGCAAMIASHDAHKGYQLHTVEPNGVSYRYFANAIGKNRQAAKTELEKINFETITCREAAQTIANIIFKNHDELKDKKFELELGWICDESNRQFTHVPRDFREEVVKKAIEEKERDEMDSDSEDDA